jgi:hypothetical protein
MIFGTLTFGARKMTEKQASSKRLLNVVGPDFDLALLKTLQPGDHVMVELNGSRLFSSNPIASEYIWTVLDINSDSITIEHPRLKDDKVILEYRHLVSQPDSTGPAVFMIQGDAFRLPEVFIVLQMISHKSDAAGMKRAKYRWAVNKKDYEEIYDDPILRRHTLEAWAKYFETFSELGWVNKSYKRFALRANIKTDTIRAFINRAWEELDKLTVDDFCNIGREMEVLPTRMILANEIQHDFRTTYSGA